MVYSTCSASCRSFRGSCLGDIWKPCKPMPTRILSACEIRSEMPSVRRCPGSGRSYMSRCLKGCCVPAHKPPQAPHPTVKFYRIPRPSKGPSSSSLSIMPQCWRTSPGPQMPREVPAGLHLQSKSFDLSGFEELFVFAAGVT